MLTKQRSQKIQDVEKLFLVWINKQQLAGDSVLEAIICEKARLLDLVKKMPGMSAAVSEFKASRGWFDKFKKRTGIHSVVKQQKSSIKVKVMLNVHLSISLVIYIYFLLFSVCKTIVILYRMYLLLIFWGVWNGLIGFTLFLMGNIASVFVRFSFCQIFSNGLITKIEVLL